MFSTHPPRPNLPPSVDGQTFRHQLITESHYVSLTQLHDRWHELADKMQETYKSMTGELARCKLRCDEDGDLGM